MLEELLSLTEVDLRQIGAALRAGRLSTPFSAVTLQRYCAAARAKAVAETMQRLEEQGLKAEHLGLMMETLAQDRSRRLEVDDIVELVWTGPEAPGIANRDTRVVVRELFANACQYVLAAGYAVYQGTEVFRALAERMEAYPQLKVRMFLNVQRRLTDTSTDNEILRRFAHDFKSREWPGSRWPEIYYDPRALEPDAKKRASLHAKCIVVDSQVAFVSSANFTQAAQVRNIEAGVLIHSARFAERLTQHFEKLAETGVLRPVPEV